ncbi:MAG: Hsp20/alpha crystallin family protein [Actinomycetota bacterium]|nr:Hsp20/alpha crystallin family protein [Actinomycetota bacterium]MDQ3573934.1 Hsp20/alpha crystallin family protein [Actinomycetota bacterium]
MLMRFDPFRELDRLSEQLPGANRQMPAVLPMDAYRRGENFVVHLDLPGTDPESVELTVERNVLTVRAERSWAPGEGDEVLISERPQGVFTRQLFLGESLDTEAIDANYDQGVLTLTIPVAEQAKPRRVEISNQAGGPTAVEASSSVAQ